MRLWSRHSYGLPLAVSVVLHAGLLGGMLAFALPSTATPAEGIDTRTADVQTRLVLLPDDADAKATPPSNVRKETGPTEFPIVIEAPPPVRADTPPVAVTPPAAVPGSGAPGTRAARPTKPGSGGQPGDTGGALFAAAPTAKSVVYVVDRSGSMGQQNAYGRACAEVVANLNQWPAATRFQIVAYNSRAQALCINASVGLLPIDADTVRKAESQLAALPPTGWTDHLCGLRCALLLAPDVLYLVTDADDLRAEDVRTITSLNKGRTVIHTVEMHSRYASPPTGALARLAGGNRGTYRRVLIED